MEYTDSGSGVPVLAVHGAMGGYDQSLILAQTLCPNFGRVLAVSRPGYLGTPLNSGKSPEEQADLYVELLNSLQIESAIVVAISGGGYSSICFAHRHPDRCKALILCSTPSGPMENRPPISFWILTKICRFDFIVKRMQKKAAQNIEASLKRSIQFPDLVQSMLNDLETLELYKALTFGMFSAMKHRLEGTLHDIHITQNLDYPLSELSIPTLVIHGTHDPIVPYETHGRRLASTIPNVIFHKVERGEHVAIFTHRKEITEQVTRFLEAQNII